MNFTREPIIETIISPKDGFKLLVRSSKAGNVEEYVVDAVEVVSFGRAFFFRSLEKPKAFLVPTSDYEVLEVKETRVALKSVPHERTIKIGGGREAPPRHREKEPRIAKEAEVSEEVPAEPTGSEPREDRRRDRRRHRRRRQPEDQEWSERRRGGEQQQEPEAPKADSVGEGGGSQDETKVSSSMFSSLFPPPSKLISETLSRYQENPPVPTEKKQEEPPVVDDNKESSGSESSPLNRIHAPEESGAFTSTHFSPLDTTTGFNPFF